MKRLLVAAGVIALTLPACSATRRSRAAPPASAFAGVWLIELTRADSLPPGRLIRGTLTLRDTSAVESRAGRQIRRDWLVGTFHIDFLPLGGGNPIGNAVDGTVGPSIDEVTGDRRTIGFSARLGEGYDRGEVELDGRVARGRVTGRWQQVYGEDAPMPSGQFVMRRRPSGVGVVPSNEALQPTGAYGGITVRRRSASHALSISIPASSRARS
jgi:hypothetical protein